MVPASNGQEALDLYLQSHQTGETYDAIILDMQMPVMDGYTATRHLRSSGCIAPILALSANVTDIDRRRGVDAGCTDFLCKPLRARELMAYFKHPKSQARVSYARASLLWTRG